LKIKHFCSNFISKQNNELNEKLTHSKRTKIKIVEIYWYVTILHDNIERKQMN